jgi:predicted DNA-binding transcriptional regulator YafY
MDKFDRIFQLHTILTGRRTPVSGEELQARLECHKATLQRVIAMMRTHLNAPIVVSQGGYRYDEANRKNAYELPGLWFTPAELQALAVVQRMLADLSSGLLEEHLKPLADRLQILSKHRRLNLGEAAGRLRFPAIATRKVGSAFQVVAAATLQRRKLWFEYHARSTNERSERTVSPQRVTHYRETWYLDAWDDGRDALRSFSVDRVSHATMLADRALDVPDQDLDTHYASAYGIFGGVADKLAVLRFSTERARWVADERWHPQQQGEYLPDGRYELRIPYRDPRELVMDIMRHGKDVEVVAPAELRERFIQEVKLMLERYLR